MNLPEEIKITKNEYKPLLVVVILAFLFFWVVPRLVNLIDGHGFVKEVNDIPLATPLEKICERYPYDTECVRLKQYQDIRFQDEDNLNLPPYVGEP